MAGSRQVLHCLMTGRFQKYRRLAKKNLLKETCILQMTGGCRRRPSPAVDDHRCRACDGRRIILQSQGLVQRRADFGAHRGG